jgi:class 3 adenylate cyclase
MHRRFVSVLYINVMNFETIMNAVPDVGMRVHAAVLHEILTAVTFRSGVVDHFHGDRFLVTFNASRVCPTPVLSALEAMMDLIHRVAQRAHKLLGDSLSTRAAVGVRVGAACGQAMCGNLGNRSMQRFATVGKCVGQANSLMQYARAELLSNAVSEEMLVHGVFHGQPLPMMRRGECSMASEGSATPPPRFGSGAVPSELSSNWSPTSQPSGGQRELLYMFVGHGILPRDTTSTTMATMIGWRGGDRVSDNIDSESVGYIAIPHYLPSEVHLLRPTTAGNSDGSGASSQAPSNNRSITASHAAASHAVVNVSLRAAMINNEAFRYFVGGFFSKARHLLRGIPAPHDRFLQRALGVVSQTSSALHE